MSLREKKRFCTIANDWKIGDAELDNGVLLLFTTEEPHVRLEIGRGLEGCLTDAESGRILDTWAVDAKDNGRWNEAAVNTFVTVAQELYIEYGVEVPDSLNTVDATKEEVSGTTMADAVFPEMLVEKNPDPFWMQVIAAFIAVCILTFIPYLIICILTYWTLYSTWGTSGSSDNWDSDSDDSDGGGYSGDGGSFGGGGASR